MLIQERDVERYLVRQCTARGWLCWKFSSPSNRAVPDRIVILPGAVVFMECKAPGRRPTRQQEALHERLRGLGALVWVVDGLRAVDACVEALEVLYGLE